MKKFGKSQARYLLMALVGGTICLAAAWSFSNARSQTDKQDPDGVARNRGKSGELPIVFLPPADQKEAIHRLQKVGAVFRYDGHQVTGVTFSWRQITNDQIQNLLVVKSLRQIDFNASPFVNDRTLEVLAKLPMLEELNLGGTRISDEGLAQLKLLPRLKKLYLWRTPLSDKGMQVLSQLPALEHLNLWDTAITDDGLAHLAGLKTLRRLGIGQSIQPGEEHGQVIPIKVAKLTAAGVGKFRQLRPGCQVFYWDRGEGKSTSPDARMLARQAAVAPGPPRPPASPTKRGPIPVSLATRQAGFDWPTFLGPEGTGKSAETNLPRYRPESQLAVVWHHNLGEGYGACAISRGRLVQLERRDSQLRVVCLHAETGRELWTHKSSTDYDDQLGYGNGPRCSPVIDGDRVYAYGADGRLFCLALETGKELWSVDTAKKFGVVQYFFGVGASPLVERDLLIVAVGGSPAEQRKGGGFNLEKLTGNGTGIVAFDKYSGQVRYAITNTLAGYATPQAVTLNGRRWCFVFARQGLVGFEPASGKVDFVFPWQAKFRAGVNAATPVVQDQHVFITEAYGPGCAMLRVAPGQAQVIWRDPPKSRHQALPSHWATPILHNGFLYGCSGRHSSEAEFRCIEWKSGKVVWREKMDALFSLLYVDDHFVLLDEYGQLQITRVSPLGYLPVYRRDLSKEQVAGRPLISYPAWSAPVLSHGLLYLRGKDRLVCLDLIPDKP